MPRGAWRYVAALGLILASPILAQEVESPRSESQVEAESGQQPGESRAESDSEQEDQPRIDLTPALEQIESAIRDLVAEERAAQNEGRDQHDVRDLQAQEEMAYWAQGVFWTGLAAVGLTFAGLVLIGFTLHYTREAAGHANTMAIEAGKATKAASDTFQEAHRANEIAQKGLVAQHRPWMVLQIDADDLEDGPGALYFLEPERVEVTLRVSAKNIGKSPARMVITDMKAFWTYTEWPGLDELTSLVQEAKSLEESYANYANIVTPDDVTKFGHVRMNAHPVKTRIDPNKQRGVGIVVACCVLYKSMLSDEWLHTANLISIRRKLPEGRHPRERPRFGWDQGEVSSDKLEAVISKAGGTSSVA